MLPIRHFLLPIVAILAGMCIEIVCSAQEASPPETLIAPDVAIKSDGALPSDEECEALGEEFEQAIANQDTEAAEALIDWDRLAELSTREFDVSANKRKDMVKGLKAGSRRLPQRFCDLVAAGGSLHFLRVRTNQGEKSLLFRQLQGTGGMNYIEFLVAKADGEVRIVDFYNYLSGERCSTTMARVTAISLAGQKKNLLERMLGLPSQMERDARVMEQVSRLLAQNEYQDALAAIDGFSPAMKKERTAHLMKIMALQHLDESQYKQVLDDYQKAFPNDPSLQLVLIDSHLLAKKYDEAIADIDHLDKSVDGDPYLSTLKSGVYRLAGNITEARKWAQKGATALPDLWETHGELLALDLAEKKYSQLLERVDALEKQFGYDLQAMLESEAFAPLATTQEYKAWAAKRPVPEDAPTTETE